MYRIVLASALLAACTSPNTAAAPNTLEGAVKVTALGVRGPSDIMVHQQGTLDPTGHDMRVAVTDVQGTLKTPAKDGDPLVIEALTITLDDVDYPPSPQMPDGLKLREQHLVAAQPIASRAGTRSNFEYITQPPRSWCRAGPDERRAPASSRRTSAPAARRRSNPSPW